MKRRSWAAGPDELIAVGLAGPWVLPMPAPRVLQVPRKSDWTTGLLVGNLLVERIRTRAGGPLEEVDALITRAAIEHGTAEQFVLQYGDGPQT
jgi:hypothetical protein